MLIFLATFLTYRFSIYFVKQKIIRNQIDLKGHFSKKEIYLLISICIAILILIPYSNPWAIIWMGHLGIVSFFYSYPAFKFTALRKLPLLKLFLISWVWANVGSIVPWLLSGQEVPITGILPLFISQFLFIISITLPFDIRDFESDRAEKIITLPGILGIKLSKVIALYFLAAFVFMIHSQLNPIGLAIFILCTGTMILKTEPGKRGYIYTIMLDGMIIVYFVLVLISGSQ